MAPPVRITHPLRAVTQRLQTTPPEQLPYIATYLADALLDCQQLLSTPADQITKGTDEGTTIHKFKTQVSTLLQAKSASQRWVAIVLVKAAVEAGGLEMVQSSGSWVRSLVGYLNRPDPASIKKIAIVTLTRIFSITRGNPAVVREITTPTLPGFITNCLNCISTGSQTKRTLRSGSPLVKVVLQSFNALLPHHPSTFRPFVNQLKPILAVLLAPTASHEPDDDTTANRSWHPSKVVIGLAQCLHALLGGCAPKNTSSEQWRASVTLICTHAHKTADQVFRSLVEENTDSRPRSDRSVVKPFNETPSDMVADELGIPAWTGLDAGSERLVGLLEMVQAHLATSSQLSISVPVHTIWNLVERLLSVFGPSDVNASKTDFTTFRPEADREEREILWRALPRIHRSAIELMGVLLDRLATTSVGISHTMLERLEWTFARDSRYQPIRSISYGVATQLLAQVGPSLTKTDVNSLGPLISQACQDVCSQHGNTKLRGMSDNHNTSSKSNNGTHLEIPTHTDLALNLAEVATLFLRTSVMSTRPDCWPSHLRTAIDRTAILEQNEDIMVASVIQPAQSNERTMASILPFLARSYPSCTEVEVIVRPRLPIIRSSKQNEQNIYNDCQDEDVSMDSATGAVEGTVISQPYAQSAPVETQSNSQRLVIASPQDVAQRPDVQSPKRLRSEDISAQPEMPQAEYGRPVVKRPRVEEETIVHEIDQQAPVNEVEDKGQEVEVYSAPPPMDDHIITVPKTSEPDEPNQDAFGKSSRENVVDDSDDSGSEIPSLHMDSDLEDDDDDDDV